MISMQRRGAGQSGRIPSSSITTSSTKADILRPGNSRNSFQKRFARASDDFANSGSDDVLMSLRLTSSLDLSVKHIIASKDTMENDASNFGVILVKILSYTKKLSY